MIVFILIVHASFVSEVIFSCSVIHRISFAKAYVCFDISENHSRNKINQNKNEHFFLLTNVSRRLITHFIVDIVEESLNRLTFALCLCPTKQREPLNLCCFKFAIETVNKFIWFDQTWFGRRVWLCSFSVRSEPSAVWMSLFVSTDERLFLSHRKWSKTNIMRS